MEDRPFVGPPPLPFVPCRPGQLLRRSRLPLFALYSWLRPRTWPRPLISPAYSAFSSSSSSSSPSLGPCLSPAWPPRINAAAPHHPSELGKCLGNNDSSRRERSSIAGGLGDIFDSIVRKRGKKIVRTRWPDTEEGSPVLLRNRSLT